MSSWRLIAAVTSAVLASGVPAMPAASAVQPSGPTSGTPYKPCPTPPSVFRPASPSPPPPSSSDPGQRAVGGPTLATKGLTIPAGAQKPPRVTATSWVVADLGSGAVLGGCGPHEYRTPASVQKLLLAATMMPRLDPAQVVQVTKSDLNFEPGSSAVGLVLGGRYSVKSLWLALLLKSGNDAANVLARVGGGSAGMQGGIQAMNAEARRLGAYQTHAATPSGLDGPGQFTSAYDLALIARACYARADFRRYTATRSALVPAEPGTPGIGLTNDNGLLDRYPGMLGGKTGFTDLARQTYVGVAERKGRRLVVTLLGAESQPLGSYGETTALLDWGFALPRDAAVGRLVTPESPKPTAPASGVPLAQPRAHQQAASSSWFAGKGLLVAAAVVLLVLLMATGRRIVGTRSAAGWRSRDDAGTRPGPPTRTSDRRPGREPAADEDGDQGSPGERPVS